MLEEQLRKAKAAQRELGASTGAVRNAVIQTMAALVRSRGEEILQANRLDAEAAEQEGISGAMLKRLILNPSKLEALALGLDAVAKLADPLGRGLGQHRLDNGLAIETLRVPLGVIALIFESRPGVSVEAGALAVKSGNALILRGGHEAQNSNRALVQLWREALTAQDLDAAAVSLIDSPDRAYVRELMHLDGLDLLIPRGGASLIQTVVKEATVPVIETGVGNCHLYVDQSADVEMAVHILRDGKVGNCAVCNAMETVLVHRAIKDRFLPRAFRVLREDGVIFHGDDETRALIPEALEATEADWATEYLSLDLAVRVVDDLEAALDHIRRYGSNHSEAIVTNSYLSGQTFLQRVDAAAVYWNASTRFTDGFQFGLGAEVGISTQKLHARGPMGLEALTTTKTIAYGSGQTRDL